MRKLFLLLCVLLATFGLASCSEESYPDGTEVPREEQFVVGLECAYQPFNWTEDKKTDTNYPISNIKGKFAEGYDVQIAKKIAAELGKTLVIKAIVWDSLITSLDTTEIDAIIAGMSDTEERRVSVNFTNAYYTSEEVCVVLKNSKYATATSINDFAGATAIGQKDTLYADLVTQLTGANVGTLLASVPDIITAMMNGKCDVTVVEKPVAEGLTAAHSELTFIEFDEANGFKVSPEDVAVCIALRKADTDLLEDINAILATISDAERESLMATAVSQNS